MAAAAQTELVNILVNDIELQVPKGEIIVESVKRLGLEIPIFCYHSRMKPVGMCRMCLVEVGFKGPDGTIKKMPKPQAACTLPASEGMAIYTDTEMVHRDRKGVLEFLLVNHPLDCPICDRGGECPLQNNTLFYGPSTSRFVELKRHAPKAFPLSDYVTLDLERCIQCGRCVRFTEEISGDAELAFRFRGAEMQPSTFELRKFTSKFSGNVIEICPVGALTNAKYRFRARPWDLETRPAICTMCSNGCNIWFDYRVNKVVRINGRTNEAVNEEWTCDKGKFGHYWYNSDKRLATPLLRKGEALVPCSWAEAYAAIIDAFAPGGNAVAALAGDQLSNEDLFLLQRLFRREFRSNNLDHRFTKHLQALDQRLENVMGIPQVQTKIEAFENKEKILVFGTSLADDEPILFLRVRKAWFKNGASIVVAHHEATDVDDFASAVLRYKPGSEVAVASGILNYLVHTGKAQVPPETREALAKFTPQFVEQTSGVPAAQLESVAATLDGAAIITTESILDTHQAQNTIEMLGGLAMTTQGEFNLYGLLSNSEGASRLGILPDSLPGLCKLSDDAGAPTQKGFGTDGILRGCDEGAVKALWLANANPLARHSDPGLVKRALENVEFLVYQGVIESEEMAYASVVLPMCPPVECDGTFTNMEGRVQRIKQVLPSYGEARPAWKVFSEVGLRIKPETPLFNPREVMDVIARTVPGWSGARYDDLPLEGTVLGAERAHAPV